MNGRGALLCLSLLLWACDRNAPAQADENELPSWEDSPPIDAKGPSFEDEDFVLAVDAPRVCETETPLSPEEGLMRVSVPLRLRAKSARPVPVSALAFILEDEEGHQFRATLAGCAPSLRQQVLRERQTVEGEVAFDVPRTVGKLEMLYEPFLMGRKAVRARVLVPSIAANAQ